MVHAGMVGGSGGGGRRCEERSQLCGFGFGLLRLGGVDFREGRMVGVLVGVEAAGFDPVAAGCGEFGGVGMEAVAAGGGGFESVLTGGGFAFSL
jgi:hypothetical protein